MTTQQIADRLVQLCRKGDYDTVYQELFDKDVVSVWPAWSPEATPTQGLDELIAKGAKWQDMMEEFKWGWTGDPIIAGNHFAVAMGFECIYKWQTTSSKEEELVVYTIRDAKIIKEEYFYDVNE